MCSLRFLVAKPTGDITVLGVSKKEIFHLCRAGFWVAMVPVAIFFGWHTSIFLVFLYSSYANMIGDIDAFEAARSQRQDDSP